MKGLIQLTVEVDYDNMITEERLEALHAYTGKATVDELRKQHMDNLGEKLVALFKDLPFVRYSLEGQFIEEPKEPTTWGEVIQEIEQAEAVDAEEPPSFDSVEQEAVEEESDDSPSLIELFDTAIAEISMEKGMPTIIKINDKMKEALEKHLKMMMVTDIGIMQTYRGFHIVQEGMEELFVIGYKPYGGSTEEFYSRSL